MAAALRGLAFIGQTCASHNPHTGGKDSGTGWFQMKLLEWRDGNGPYKCMYLNTWSLGDGLFKKSLEVWSC